MTDGEFFVRFWGVRGSIACPGPETAAYGGNTSCIAIHCGPHLLVFDAGTGLRKLGLELAAGGAVDADLFLSHTHIDHIEGLPFFRPAYLPGNRLRIWSGHLEGGMDTEGALRHFMNPPVFPVSVDAFGDGVSFHDFTTGDTLAPSPGVRLRTAALNHPQNATGYRVDYGGRSICYVTDTEHRPDRPDENILALIEGADVVIYDSMFTDAEYPRFAGWGHSTWQEGARLCRSAGARTLAIFHHLPERADADLDRIALEARDAFPGAVVAREGMTLAP